MLEREYKTKIDVLTRGREAIGIPIGKIDKTGRLKTGKGAVGTVLEESWFGYAVNSESAPDFEEAGVELKATPYIYTNKGIRAKERLVCNIINYMEEYKKTFQTSSFYLKCNTILIMSYEHKKNVDKVDFTIDEAVLFGFPKEDLIIIQKDWEIIIEKINSGLAHEISEGDTLYLGACTKGASASSVRSQPFSELPAKQRAFSLKQSYMSYILNRYIFGKDEDEHIIKNPNLLNQYSLFEYVALQFKSFIGKSQSELKRIFNISSTAKSLNHCLVSGILKVKNVEESAEFQKANIKLKTIRLESDGNKIQQSMSFPSFLFKDIANQEWEESQEYEFFFEQKYLLVIFKMDNKYNLDSKNKEYTEQHLFLDSLILWQMPEKDIDEVRRIWEKTAEIIRRGVMLDKVPYGNSFRIKNNLPKISQSYVAHVRPHTSKKGYFLGGEEFGDLKYANELPDGRWMTTQSFWLNNEYILSQIRKGKTSNI